MTGDYVQSKSLKMEVSDSMVAEGKLHGTLRHYNDVTWELWRLRSPTNLFLAYTGKKQRKKSNIDVASSLWGESLSQRASHVNAETFPRHDVIVESHVRRFSEPEMQIWREQNAHV